MPGRRPAPLSDELFGAGPLPVLLGATNNGMPLPVKNTFVDMPSGLTPASMKNGKPTKGMLSAPADLNQRSPGFLQRALSTGADGGAPALGAAEEALGSPREPAAALKPSGNPPESSLQRTLDVDLAALERASHDPGACTTPPATLAVPASLFQSPGATPVAENVGQLAALQAALRRPDASELVAGAYQAATMPGYASMSWATMPYMMTPTSAQAGALREPQGMTPETLPRPAASAPAATLTAVPAQAPAQQLAASPAEKAPAEKLLLLEEAPWSRRATNTVDATCPGPTGCCGRAAEVEEDDDDESVAESEAALQPASRAPEDVPKPPAGALHPSKGSESHSTGGCKRCCFYPRGRCLNGYECGFCHYDHDKRKRKTKNKKTKGSTTPAASPNDRLGSLPNPKEAVQATLPAQASTQETEGARTISLAPAMTEDRGVPVAGTTVAAFASTAYMGYYQADSTSSFASLLTSGGSMVASAGAYAATAQPPFFIYSLPDQSETGAAYGAMAEGCMQLAATASEAPLGAGCSGCSSGVCGSLGHVGVQQALLPAAAQGPAPPPVQPPRLQPAVSEFTPPPPMQSPKLPCEPVSVWAR